MIDLRGYNTAFKRLYGQDENMVDRQFERYGLLVDKFNREFSSQKIHLFSSPGRIEIGGNHTDHNNGCVLAASVNLDAIAAVAPNDSNLVKILSEGYPPFQVDLSHLDTLEDEYGTSSALIRGLAFSFKKHGYLIGGFDAGIQSDIPQGSGLSSSASFEVLMATIFNLLFNENSAPPEEIAKYSQYAESTYFKKPCGLMDQITCALGGLLHIDFKNPQKPVVKKMDFDLTGEKYEILTVDTGGSHADLTDDYAAIPAEMKSVARALSGEVCRDITAQQVIGQIRKLREQVGDRAVLRALHFLEENKRVSEQVMALKKGDFNLFLKTGKGIRRFIL